MARRASKWIIHNGGKYWELSKGGRSQYSGMTSREEVLSRLRQHFKKGETVVLEEEDGYRSNITAQLLKRGLI